jgi:hypothetical protein
MAEQKEVLGWAALRRRYIKFIVEKVTHLISVDLMIINSASAWLRYLSHRHDIHDVDMFAKEETASDNEAPDNKELTK